MKKILIKQNCRIAPYKDRQLEVIRNNKRIIVSDGSVKENDKVELEENLASKIVNTIFGDKAIAEYIEEEETNTTSEDEEETEETNTTSENEEETEETNTASEDEVKEEVKTKKTNATSRQGRSKSK